MISDDEESEDLADEDIDIEEEIDEDDPVKARHDEMSGFRLLELRYLVRAGPILQQENNRVCSDTDFVNPDDRPIRPKTGSVVLSVKRLNILSLLKYFVWSNLELMIFNLIVGDMRSSKRWRRRETPAGVRRQAGRGAKPRGKRIKKTRK